jgi:hypothetical protein
MMNEQVSEVAPEAAMADSGTSAVRGLCIAAFFLLWAAAGWISLLGDTAFRDGGTFGLDPGPYLMPVIVLGFISCGGVALAVGALWRMASGPEPLRIRVPRFPSHLWQPLLFLLTTAAFPVAMTVTGYLPAILIFVFCWALVLDGGLRIRPLRSLAVATVAAVAVALVIHVGFDRVIHARLP